MLTRHPTRRLGGPVVLLACAAATACGPGTKPPDSGGPAGCGSFEGLTEAVGEFHTSFEDKEGDVSIQTCSAFWLITATPSDCESCDLRLDISGRIDGATCEWDGDLRGYLEFEDGKVDITASSFIGHFGWDIPVEQESDCRVTWNNQAQVDDHHESHGSDAFFPKFSGFLRW